MQLVKSLTINQDIPYDTKWNKLHQVDIAKVSIMHALYMSSIAYIEGVEKIDVNQTTKEVLSNLCHLFICENIVHHGEQALLHGYINKDHLMDIQDYISELAEKTRPFLVSLTEAPVVHDGAVQGVSLSGYNDDYASTLYNNVKLSQLNTKTKLDAIDEAVKPLSRRLTRLAKM